jgi:general secretion pathway protein G
MSDKNAQAGPSGRGGEAGYSLLEILVAVAIIASLAALVGPRLLGQVDKSKVTTAKVQIKMLETALMTYYSEGGALPEGSEGLEILVRNLQNDPNWAGPYLSEEVIPLDPWGSGYQYLPPARPGSIGEVFSLGADKQPGGNGLNADIS